MGNSVIPAPENRCPAYLPLPIVKFNINGPITHFKLQKQNANRPMIFNYLTISRVKKRKARIWKHLHDLSTVQTKPTYVYIDSHIEL